MREAFAMQKLLTFFQQKYKCISDTDVWNFNKMLTNEVVSFEQSAPDGSHKSSLTRVNTVCQTICIF